MGKTVGKNGKDEEALSKPMRTATPPPSHIDTDKHMLKLLKCLSADELSRLERDLQRQLKDENAKLVRLEEQRLMLAKKLKERNEELKIFTGLPHAVANVVELLQVDWWSPEVEQDVSRSEALPEFDLNVNGDFDSISLSETVSDSDDDAQESKDYSGFCENKRTPTADCSRREATWTAANANTLAVVVKTMDRNTYLLPGAGFVGEGILKPGDLVALHRVTRVIVDILPPLHDPRVKAMEIETRPSCSYEEIGGLHDQLNEIKEAIVFPVTKKHLFQKIGLQPCKGILLYGPPGTGKTMIARAVAAQTDSTFLRLSATALIQMYIGDGSRLVRQAFELAKQKAPAIIFIDEIDAIGTTRNFAEGKSGGREVQRTLIELLNQLDGFDSYSDVKLIAATNRMDLLDPALMRSGRLDRKIEIPLPNEIEREEIIRVYCSKLKVSKNVNLEEIAKCTANFNGAQCRAVVMEAGMAAVRKNQRLIMQEDFMDGITEVLARKRCTNKHIYA